MSSIQSRAWQTKLVSRNGGMLSFNRSQATVLTTL